MQRFVVLFLKNIFHQKKKRKKKEGKIFIVYCFAIWF